MAFNSSTIKTRYSASGNIAVLKSDWTKVCDDLIAMQTFMKTASADAGKFTTLFADSLTSSGAISGTNISASGALSGATLTVASAAWPAGILLNAINTGGRASATNGSWATLQLDGSIVPGTNIGVGHLKRVATSITTSVSLLCETGGTEVFKTACPSYLGGDGGNNINFFWIGHTASLASYGGGAINLSAWVVPGSNCTNLTAGSTFFGPIFAVSGTNSSGTSLAMNITCRMYSIAEL